MNLKDPFSQNIFEVYHVRKPHTRKYIHELAASCRQLYSYSSVDQRSVHRNRRVKIPARGPGVEFSATVPR
jgi:hypothetical protein